jgi:KRAB domain-containing zinc finger protein
LTTDHGTTKPFKCRHCGWTGTTGKSLYDHVKQIHRDVVSDKEVQCYFCSEMVSEDTIVKHIRNEHKRINVVNHQMYGERRQHSCHVCKASLKVELGKCAHHCRNLLPTGKDVKSCEKCDIEFKSKVLFLDHLSSDHGKSRPFKCCQCVWTGVSGMHQYYHFKRRHTNAKPGLEYKCEFCQKEFSSRGPWRKHLIHKHDQPKYQPKTPGHFPCKLCSRVFDNESALKGHRTNRHNQPSTEQSTCEICGLVVNILEKHMREEHVLEEHLAKIPCRCEKCNTDFTSALDLNTHLASCLTDPKSFKCKICQTDDKWHSGIALRRHLAEIHQKLRSPCGICGVIVKHKSLLKLHTQRIHSGAPLQFTCEHCGKSFLKKKQMTSHIMSMHYSGKKPYPCSDCDKSYPNETTLKRHVNAAHTKEIKYKCPQCNYVTYSYGVLPKHILEVHDKLKRHNCKSCDAGYFYKRDLVKHLAANPDHEGVVK